MKKNNAWNRFFFKDVLEKQERTYRKLKKMLAEYPSIIDVVINAKNLTTLFNIHKTAWAAGFCNKNLGPCEWGMFRTECITTMQPGDVYIGSIWGLNTKNIPDWDKIGDEVMGPNGFGIPKDTKIYDLIVEHYKTVLRSNINAIRSEALEYIGEYESLNDNDDEYSIL